MRTLSMLLVLAATACTTTYEFDPVELGDETAGRDPVPRSSSQFVNAVFADLVGRTPEQHDFVVTDGTNELFRFPLDEQDILVGSIDAVGDPTPVRDLLVAGLLRSPEVDVPSKSSVDDPAEFIADQFRRLLGREPNAYELTAFVDEWSSGAAVGPRAVIRAIVGSREYQSR